MTRIPIPLTIVLTAGAVFAACYQDRGVLFSDGGTPNDGATSSNAGAGGAGTTATTGGAGATATGGGAGGSTVPAGCDVKPIMAAHSCTVTGTCHDANGSAAGLDLKSPGWEARLLGGSPQKQAGAMALSSMCADQPRTYLVPGSNPAVGLLLQKLGPNPPCGAQMPLVSSPLTATELACFQAWANALTAGTTETSHPNGT